MSLYKACSSTFLWKLGLHGQRNKLLEQLAFEVFSEATQLIHILN